jgi:Uma2 family endonuclease
MAVEYRTEREYWERLDGVDYPKVSPKTAHSLVQSRLSLVFIQLAQQRGKVGTEWKFRIGRVDGTDSWFLPDVSFVSIERLRALPRQEREEPPFAPNIAVEIRSPNERKSLRERKIERYVATGAILVLDVDPETRTIHAFGAGGSRTFASGDRFNHPAASWLVFDVASAFVDLDLD